MGVATKLGFEVKTAEATVSKAKSLISKLTDEQHRWNADEKHFANKQDHLATDILKAAIFTTFLTSYTEQDRQQKIAELNWQDFSVLNFLSTDTDQLNWKTQGLNSDQQSLENMSIQAIQPELYPLIIDSSDKTVDFLTNWLQSDQRIVETVSCHSKQLFSTVELCLRFGKTLIITNCNKIPEQLYPILRNDFSGDAQHKSVQLGDKNVDVNSEFRLFLVTNSVEKIFPSIKPYLTTFNYSATQDGLSSQLLSQTIQIIRPDLEEKRENLVKNSESSRLKLAELENNLLIQLAEIKGSILENSELLSSLDESKQQSQIQKQSLLEAEKTQAQFDSQRNAYAEFARKSMKIFFALQRLASLKSEYRFGIGHFTFLFKSTVESCLKNSTLEPEKIFAILAKNIFSYSMLTISSNDLVIAGLYLAKSIQNVNENEFQALTKALDAIGRNIDGIHTTDQSHKFTSSWQAATDRIVSMLEAKHRGILDQIYSGRHDSSILRALSEIIRQPNNSTTILTQYICDAIGVESLTQDAVFDIGLSFPTKTPIFIFVSSGADPSMSLKELVSSHIGVEKFREISLGQGQQDTVIELVREASEKGYWVLVQNLHLYTSWLPTLQACLADCEHHENFRIFLTSEAHPNIPVSLLESSVKISFEAPPGLKNSLVRTLQDWKSKNLFHKGGASRARSLYALAWLHAVCLERKRYSQAGWLGYEQYEFNLGDLRSAKIALEEVLARKSKETKRGGIAWTALNGILHQCIYGGRLNSSDSEILLTHLEELFSDRLLTKSASIQKIALPASSNIDDYIKATSDQVSYGEAKLFGLPENIDKTVQTQNNAEFNAKLNQLTKNDSSSLKMESEVVNLQNLFRKLEPKLTSSQKVEKSNHPVLLFLQRDIELARALVAVIKSELFDILPEKSKLEIAGGVTPESWCLGGNAAENMGPSLFIRSLSSKISNYGNLKDKFIGVMLM